jgi:hypothetical protein
MMERIYSTADLQEILAAERHACISGQRLDLAAQPLGHPMLDRLIEPTGIQKFTAYENFRQAVHQYQRDHQVSGLVWTEITIAVADNDGAAIGCRFPCIDPELISLPTDLIQLQAAKASVIEFWQSVTVMMGLFLRVERGPAFAPIVAAAMGQRFDRAEWATITSHGRDRNLELILQLGWGQPELAAYDRGFPDHGSEFIHAVYPGREPIG